MAKGKYEYWLTPDGLLRLEAYARDGLTDEQIAHNMDVGYSTLQAWKSKYQDIQDSLKKGKEVVDIAVENALLKRAIGYNYKEIKKEVSDDGIKITETIKEVLPDTTAQIFWLKNRKVKVWGGQQSHLGSAEIEINDDPRNIRNIMMAVVKMVADGDMDDKKANTIISACNSVLTAVRTDEYEKKIIELAQLMEQMLDSKGGSNRP